MIKFFGKIFFSKNFFWQNFFAKFILWRKFYTAKISFFKKNLQNIFRFFFLAKKNGEKYFCQKFSSNFLFGEEKKILANFFAEKIFFAKIFLGDIFFGKNLFLQIFFSKNFLGENFFLAKTFFLKNLEK